MAERLDTSTPQLYLDAWLAWTLSFPVSPKRIRRLRTEAKYGPCPCGSGKKYKFCCMKREVQSDG